MNSCDLPALATAVPRPLRVHVAQRANDLPGKSRHAPLPHKPHWEPSFPPDPAGLLPPAILAVTPSQHLLAELRQRLSPDCDLLVSDTPLDALERIRHQRLDLCLVETTLPHLDAATFVERARLLAPSLGFVFIADTATPENLRLALAARAEDLLSTPLPPRDALATRIATWTDRARRRQREATLLADAAGLAQARASALLERDAEFVASETARDALLQTASTLTTLQAHLATASQLLGTRLKTDPSSAAPIAFSLSEALRTAEAAMASTEAFFNTAYGTRDSSPATLDDETRHAIAIAARMGGLENSGKSIDFLPLHQRHAIAGLSGVEFLAMLAPAVAVAIALAPPRTTIVIRAEHLPRLGAIRRQWSARDHLWLNGDNLAADSPGVSLLISCSAPPLDRAQLESWLGGDLAPLSAIPARSLAAGIRKCAGALAVSIAPRSERFRLVLALPT